jgi:hypothetical protein
MTRRVFASLPLLFQARTTTPTVAPAYTSFGLRFADAEVPKWSNGGFFLLTNMPSPPQSLKFYRNGVRWTQSVDYALSSPTGSSGMVTPLDPSFTFDPSDTYIADYRY